MADKANPWSIRENVALIPEHGVHREFEADAAERDALAAAAGLRAVSSAQAWFDVTPIPNGRVHVTGRVSARIGQTCVVTLDPVDNAIDEPIDLIFAPASQISELSRSVDDGDDDAETPDPPEPIVEGVIDLGRVAADALFLGIDPYPRKSGVVFEPVAAPLEPEDHPFAALKALKAEAGAPAAKAGKPKDG
jgi:uncharacterized metal-binding protein YceD (DUF177 family)